jgi:hypothetical protein
MKKLLVVIMFIISSGCVMAQHTADIENVDYSKSITPVVGILGRWNFNKRMAIRGQLFTGNLKAEGIFSNANIGQSGPRLVPEEYPRDIDQIYNFKRSFQSVEALFEFNFRNYKLGSTKKDMFTPFVSVGLGGFLNLSR